MKQDFLFEIGTEELPPKALPKLAASLQTQVLTSLKEAGLSHGKCQLFYAPRRIGVLIDTLETVQPDKPFERRGPSLQAAYDSEGNPTKACDGFLKSCGLNNADQCELLKTDKGEWLVYRGIEKGVETKALLPGMIEKALRNLPIPKMMRWGSHDFSFVRPVHWVVMLLGEQIVPAKLFDVHAGNQTYGHRVHAPEAIVIDKPKNYVQLLEEKGHVLADPQMRKRIIQEQVCNLAEGIDGRALWHDALLEEVNNIVEWPEAMLASFDQGLLKVPQEALIMSMQSHQKAFAITDKKGQLKPNFIFISNINSIDPALVVKGNEKVMAARLNDARFFYEQDLKIPLISHLEALSKVTFQKQLGSVGDQVMRTKAVALHIAEQVGAHCAQVAKVSDLAKCDLMTEMVMEFPELQGVMGKYYAQAEGEDVTISQAIEDHYKPNFSGDNLPGSDVATCVALADKLVTLVGIFGIGQKPSGTKDPYKLRRAAIGVLRLLIEKGYSLDLLALLDFTVQQYGSKLTASGGVVQAVHAYIVDRLRSWYQSSDIALETFDAVIEVESQNLLDINQRIQAVEIFLGQSASAALIAANKRVQNILKSIKDDLNDQVLDTSLLVEPAEQNLYQALHGLEKTLTAYQDQKAYTDYLNKLPDLKETVDIFFDNIRIMTDDAQLKNNRLILLKQLALNFNWVADLSKCQ